MSLERTKSVLYNDGDIAINDNTVTEKMLVSLDVSDRGEEGNEFYGLEIEAPEIALSIRCELPKIEEIIRKLKEEIRYGEQ